MWGHGSAMCDCSLSGVASPHAGQRARGKTHSAEQREQRRVFSALGVRFVSQNAGDGTGLAVGAGGGGDWAGREPGDGRTDQERFGVRLEEGARKECQRRGVAVEGPGDGVEGVAGDEGDQQVVSGVAVVGEATGDRGEDRCGGRRERADERVEDPACLTVGEALEVNAGGVRIDGRPGGVKDLGVDRFLKGDEVAVEREELGGGRMVGAEGVGAAAAPAPDGVGHLTVYGSSGRQAGWWWRAQRSVTLPSIMLRAVPG